MVVVLPSVTGRGVLRGPFLAGVQGHVLTTSPLATLTEGLCAALSGEVYVDPRIATSLAPRADPDRGGGSCR